MNRSQSAHRVAISNRTYGKNYQPEVSLEPVTRDLDIIMSYANRYVTKPQHTAKFVKRLDTIREAKLGHCYLF